MLAKSQVKINVQNRYGNTALHSACGYGIASHFGSQLLLSDKKCDTNIEDKNGYTALAITVKRTISTDDPWAECIKALLSHPDIAINQQATFHSHAAASGCYALKQSHLIIIMR